MEIFSYAAMKFPCLHEEMNNIFQIDSPLISIKKIEEGKAQEPAHRLMKGHLVIFLPDFILLLIMMIFGVIPIKIDFITFWYKSSCQSQPFVFVMWVVEYPQIQRISFIIIGSKELTTRHKIIKIYASYMIFW